MPKPTLLMDHCHTFVALEYKILVHTVDFRFGVGFANRKYLIVYSCHIFLGCFLYVKCVVLHILQDLTWYVGMTSYLPIHRHWTMKSLNTKTLM